MQCLMYMCEGVTFVPLQYVFVDHNSRFTTYVDPRLPYSGNELVKIGQSSSTGGVVSQIKKFL